MDDYELRSIISGLISKSEKKKVNWIHSSEIDPRVSDSEEDYTVKLDKSSININRFTLEPNLQERIGFVIYNARGKEIFKEIYATQDYLYSELDNLIELAANKVDDIDETINSIKKELQSSGEIGHSSTDNEIPF